MLPPRALAVRSRLAALACAALLIAGCGGGTRQSPELTFETLPDTLGLSEGEPIVDDFEVSRMDNGALRVEGAADLPDGTRLQIAIRPPGGGASLAMTHALVEGRRFATAPLLGDHGALPRAEYRVEVTARFTPEWQSPEVLRATVSGQSLRGPGVTRARDGAPSFYLSEEVDL